MSPLELPRWVRSGPAEERRDRNTLDLGMYTGYLVTISLLLAVFMKHLYYDTANRSAFIYIVIFLGVLAFVSQGAYVLWRLLTARPLEIIRPRITAAEELAREGRYIEAVRELPIPRWPVLLVLLAVWGYLAWLVVKNGDPLPDGKGVLEARLVV